MTLDSSSMLPSLTNKSRVASQFPRAPAGASCSKARKERRSVVVLYRETGREGVGIVV